MADYGLKVFDSSGNVTLDVTDKITRFRYSNEVDSDADGNTTLSGISGLSSAEFSIRLDEGFALCPHLVSRSGTTLTWTAQSSANKYGSSDSLIFVFLYT